MHKIGRAGLSVCGIQESRRTKTGSALISSTIDNNHKYEIYWSGHSLKRIHDVAIAIKVEKNIIMEEIKQISPRIIVAELSIPWMLPTSNELLCTN